MTISSMLDRRIIDVNDAFLRQSGYTREEIVGRPPQETMAFFDFGRMQGFRQTLFDQGYLHNIECPFRTRSGERRCAIFSAEIVEIADEPCMLAVALDVTESKLAAQALEKIACDKTELLKKMNDAQHLARIGSWEWDILTDRMWWSDETYRIFGASPGELVPSLPVIEKFLYTADLELFHNSIAHSLRTGEPLEQDCRISVGQDPLVYCHIKGEVVADDADKPVRFLGTIMDITEKNQAEKALREVEERFRLTFEHIANGMAVFEAVGDGEDFRIKEFNPAAERICRVKRDEVLGRLISQAFPSIKDIGLFAVLQRVSRTGIAERLPASYYVDDNVALWVENDVIRLPSGEIVSIFDDITDRKLAEAEMRKSETWHRSLVELGVSAYIVLNEKRRIEYASQLVEKIFGWQPAEMFGMSAFEFVISEDLEAASRFFAEIAKTPRRKKRIRVRVRLKNGDAKVVEMFGINLFDEPAVRGIVLSSHDITEQVRAEERIESFRQELTHASRMASLGALAAGIAHEINQPLSIMSTWTEIAQREIRDRLSGDKREANLALARIDAALERSSLIVRNMRNFVRKSESSVTSISLAEAIEDVRMFLSHQIRTSGVAFSVESSPEFPPVLADRTQVQQVLMNLVLNALEAMECDEISARCMEIRVRTNGDLAEVAVSDSGCGLSPDQLEHIFEPFHTTKAEGLGLGLSICRSIIQWHGGRIWAARNADRGLTFTFTLPIAKEKNRHAKKTDHLHRGRRTRGS
jgi:PAS domain S-box-containing protein